MTVDETLSTTDPPADHLSATTGQIRQVDGRWERLCSNCEEWIGLGPKGGNSSFVAHQRHKRCWRTKERKARQEAKAALETLMPSSSTTTTSQSCAAVLATSDSLFHPSPSPTPFPPLLTPGPSSSISTTAHTTSLSTNPTSFHIPPPTTASHVPRHSDEVTVRLPCEGIEFKWEYGSLFLSYPLQYHETGSPTWSLDGIGEQGSSHMIRLRSHSCARLRDPPMEACLQCTNIVSSQSFQNMLKHVSKDPLPNTPYIYFNWAQLESKLRCTKWELQLERKQNCAFYKKIQRLTRKLNDYERLCYHISMSDYKNVNLVLRTSLKNGSSPGAMVAKLQLAIQGAYTPRPSVDEQALDVGYLVKAIGGPRLLFALNRCLSLPSYHTIDRHRKVPHLIPSILSPTPLEISENISTFFNPKERPTSSIAGHSLLIDGVALEEKCRWLRSLDSIIGLCREHAGSLDLRVQNLQSITSVQEALNQDKPRAHYASEATVVAIGPFRSSNYSAIPVALSGSCKGETGDGMARWLKDVIHAWRDQPSGAATHGPIWSIATDGESTMKACRFRLCMSQALPHSDPLYSLLKNLTGLNLQTGEGNVTMTCDPKHVMKRFATLLRNSDGILVNRSIGNKNHIRSHLIQLPETDTKMVESLVDPADKQNVPKAVALIQLISKLQTLDTAAYNPSQVDEHETLTAIGTIFSAFMNPFIDVNMSLAEQLTSLSKYSHALFVLYAKHSTDFMTSQLYADSQAIVKDIFFCVAKQQILDPTADFYIILCGTDRLEVGFCLARTQTHHRNFDMLDLANKLATSSLIDSVYLRNPQLDAGSRRLKTSGAIGVDHVNPKSWKGDVSVGRVSLQVCWEEGRKQAIAFISSIYPEDPAPDFDTLFEHPHHDLLRPEGRYIGISNEFDPSLVDDSSQTHEPTPRNTGGPPVSTATTELPADPDVDNSRICGPTPDGDDNDDDDNDNDDEDDGKSEGKVVDEDGCSDDEGGGLEDLLPDSVDESLDGFLAKPEEWLEVDGQQYHKGSLISQYLKANRSKKAVERLLRVRGITPNDFQKHHPAPLIGEDNFQVGDLSATLVRTGTAVCLVIFQAIAIRKERSTHHIIDAETLAKHDSGYRVEGQVLHLVQSHPDLWAWPPHSFLKVSKPKKGSQPHKSGIRDFALTVQGPLCYRLSQDITLTSQALPASNLGSGPSRTWTFDHSHLRDLAEHIWTEFVPKDVHPNEIPDKVETLPRVWDLEKFPYKDRSGMDAFTIDHVALTPPNAPDPNITQGCPLCNNKMKLKQLRGHIGRHILFHLRGMEENIAQKIGRNPCGFCGASGCTTRLVVQGGKQRVESNCRFYSPFKYGSAKKPTISSPCTNVPIYCPHCKETIWKYNAADHISTTHHELSAGNLDKRLMVDIQVQVQEERWMKVPPELTDRYRSEHNDLCLSGEDLAVVEGEVEQEREHTKKRSRHNTCNSKNKKQRH